MPPKTRISDKAVKFVDEYLKDLNATQAAIRAGYAPKRADSTAYNLLRNTEIQGLLSIKRQELAEKCEITPESVLREERRLAFSNIGKVFRPEDFELIPPYELPEDVAAAVSGIKRKVKNFRDKEGNETQIITWEYTFWSKTTALDMINRKLGFYEADNRQKGPLELRVVYEDRPIENAE